MKVPSPPLNLAVIDGELMFSSPEYGGGRNISQYQVWPFNSNLARLESDKNIIFRFKSGRMVLIPGFSTL